MRGARGGAGLDVHVSRGADKERASSYSKWEELTLNGRAKRRAKGDAQGESKEHRARRLGKC